MTWDATCPLVLQRCCLVSRVTTAHCVLFFCVLTSISSNLFLHFELYPILTCCPYIPLGKLIEIRSRTLADFTSSTSPPDSGWIYHLTGWGQLRRNLSCWLGALGASRESKQVTGSENRHSSLGVDLNLLWFGSQQFISNPTLLPFLALLSSLTFLKVRVFPFITDPWSVKK